MRFFILIAVYASVSLGVMSYASDEHGHDHNEAEEKQNTTKKHEEPAKESGEEHEHEESDNHAHEDEHSDAHGDEHGEGHGDEHGEENSGVGPDKGIREKGAEGFKLSPEAEKQFQLQTSPISANSFSIPRKALVEIKNDHFIYRIRNGWIKRIPVVVSKKNKSEVTVELKNYQAGDLVLVAGTGFVRTAELVTEEGMAGHSH